MLLGKNDLLLFTGDSITDCGRGLPVGERNQLGNGYVSMVNALLTAVYPNLRIRVLNTGVSGNTVVDLKARWESDVLNLNPDWVSMMIGINDVWRQFDHPFAPERHVPPDVYERTLHELVGRTKVKGIILMTPFFIENNTSDDMRQMVDKYGDIVKKVAAANDTVLVDTQAAFDEVLAHLPSEMFAADRVHPGPEGHMVLARAFLNAVGFRW